jgi:DNA-binding GntR family transcriptional regulator
MVSYDDKRNLCRDSYTVARLIEQTIFNQITHETTPQMFAEALENLTRLCQRFENNLDLFHYAAISGSHQCIRDVYEDARARLENLRIMQPPPKPASRQPLRTPAEVLEAVAATIHLRPDATVFGTEEDIPDDRSPR